MVPYELLRFGQIETNAFMVLIISQSFGFLVLGRYRGYKLPFNGPFYSRTFSFPSVRRSMDKLEGKVFPSVFRRAT